MATSANEWPPVALKLLLAIAVRSQNGRPTKYEPAAWLRQRPTSRNRSRWSRWTLRLANAGLLVRITELNRDRVRRVEITPLGLKWIEETCGPGALSALNCQWNQLIHDFVSKQNGHTYSHH